MRNLAQVLSMSKDSMGNTATQKAFILYSFKRVLKQVDDVGAFFSEIGRHPTLLSLCDRKLLVQLKLAALKCGKLLNDDVYKEFRRATRQGVSPSLADYNALLASYYREYVTLWKEGQTVITNKFDWPGPGEVFIHRNLRQFTEDLLQPNPTKRIDSSKLQRMQEITRIADRLFSQMKTDGIKPNSTTFGLYLCLLPKFGHARNALESKPQGTRIPTTALIHLYSLAQLPFQLKFADNLRKEQASLGFQSACNTPLLNAMITAYIKHDRVQRAFALVQQHLPFIRREYLSWKQYNFSGIYSYHHINDSIFFLPLFIAKPPRTSLHHLLEECSRLVKNPLATMTAWQLLLDNQFEPRHTSYVAILTKLPSQERMRLLWMYNTPTSVKSMSPILTTALIMAYKLGDKAFAHELFKELMAKQPPMTQNEVERLLRALMDLKLGPSIREFIVSVVKRNKLRMSPYMVYCYYACKNEEQPSNKGDNQSIELQLL